MKVYFNNDEIADFDNSNELNVEEIRTAIINSKPEKYSVLNSANYSVDEATGNLSFFIKEKALG